MLSQLALLVEDDERIVSLGPPPAFDWGGRRVRELHRPLGIEPLAAWRAAEFADARPGGIHAWSQSADMATGVLGWADGMILSLPALPRGADLKALVARLTLRFEPAQGGRVASMFSHPLTVTVPTEASRMALLKACAEHETSGASAPAVYVLPPAAEPLKDAAEARARVRKALGLNDEHCLLVAPDEMVRGAGHHYASWVQAILREIVPQPRLLLPGSGPHERYVRYFAGTTGRDDEEYFTEDRFPLADCLAAADIAMLLHEWDCGVAALVGAMAAGLPIIASRTSDIVECLGAGADGDSPTAVLVEPGAPRLATAAALKLVDDMQLARRYGQAAKERAACYSVASAKARLAEIRAGVASACSSGNML